MPSLAPSLSVYNQPTKEKSKKENVDKILLAILFSSFLSSTRNH